MSRKAFRNSARHAFKGESLGVGLASLATICLVVFLGVLVLSALAAILSSGAGVIVAIIVAVVYFIVKK